MQQNNSYSGNQGKRTSAVVTIGFVTFALWALFGILSVAADTFVPVRKEIYAREAPVRARFVTFFMVGSGCVALGAAVGFAYSKIRNELRKGDLIESKDNMLPAVRGPKGKITVLAPAEAQMLAAGYGKMSPDIIKAYMKLQEKMLVQEAVNPPLPAKLPIYEVKKPTNIALPIGQSVDGAPLFLPLEQQSPALIAGSPGGGKSEAIASMIAAVGMFWPAGDTVQVALCDPKGLDFARLPQTAYMPYPVAHKPEECVDLIRVVLEEMQRRKNILAQAKAANIGMYRRDGGQMPYLVILIDEVSRLTDHRIKTLADDATSAIQLLGEQGRAFGIVPILATQRPHGETIARKITGICDARVCFRVATDVESRMVLGRNGAELLEGKGELIYRYSGLVMGKGYYAGIESGDFGNFLSSAPRLSAPPPQPQLEAPPVVIDGQAARPVERSFEQTAPAVAPVTKSISDWFPQDRAPKPHSNETRFVFHTWLSTAKDSRDKKPSLSATVRRLYGTKTKGGPKFGWVRAAVLEQLALKNLDPAAYGISAQAPEAPEIPEALE